MHERQVNVRLAAAFAQRGETIRQREAALEEVSLAMRDADACADSIQREHKLAPHARPARGRAQETDVADEGRLGQCLVLREQDGG